MAYEEEGAGRFPSASLEARGVPKSDRPSPGDLGARRSAPAKAGAKPVGAIAAPELVRAVYDSRPINAFDFQQFVRDDTAYTAAFVSSIQMTVPSGYVAVLRSFALEFFTGSTVFIPVATATVSPCRNAQAQPYFARPLDLMFTPPGLDVDCFFVADERELMGVQVNYSTVPAATINSIRVLLYGQLIPKRGGISSQFAIGSK